MAPKPLAMLTLEPPEGRAIALRVWSLHHFAATKGLARRWTTEHRGGATLRLTRTGVVLFRIKAKKRRRP